MKKFLSMALVLAMMVSTAALTACGDDSTSTNGSTKAPTSSGSGNVTSGSQTQPGDVASKPATSDQGTQPATPPSSAIVVPDDPFMAQFHGYTPIDNMEAYKADHKNLMESFVGIVMSQSIFNGNDWTNSEDDQFIGLGKEDAPNLFDGDPETKWCCSRSDVEYAAALVWEMTEAVDVVAYSITTGNDNVEWTSRNPVQWRLYGTNTLPETVMTDENPDEGDTYLRSMTVPEGWVLIDAVDAADPDNPMLSQVPDENFKEVGFEVAHPGQYKYFLFLIDYAESDDITFQLADFTLFGNN